MHIKQLFVRLTALSFLAIDPLLTRKCLVIRAKIKFDSQRLNIDVLNIIYSSVNLS